MTRKIWSQECMYRQIKHVQALDIHRTTQRGRADSALKNHKDNNNQLYYNIIVMIRYY